MVKIRDPQAKSKSDHNKRNRDNVLAKKKKTEWMGAFSDYDQENWTEAMKTELVHSTDENDGIFFMKIEDFAVYFDTLYACHYNTGNTLSSLQTINDSKSIACFQFNVSQKGDYYFGVSQEDIRTFEPGHHYGILSIVVGKMMKGGQVKFIAAKGGDNTRDSWCMAKCMPGQYLAFVTTHWARQNLSDGEIGFWVYGPEALHVDRIMNVDHIRKSYNILKMLFIDYVSSFPYT